MSLSVVNAGGAPASVGTGLLADLNLTSAQSAQIEQILSELQTGMISPVEARAQITGIVSSPQQPAAPPVPTGHSTSTGPQPGTQSAAYSSPSQPSEPLQSFYELPLPQESLKGSGTSYNSVGAATETVFTAFNTVNAHA
ncbi:MAG: hypothetical protein ACRENA_06625 [Vulcanimicrobiaceae bacterium]